MKIKKAAIVAFLVKLGFAKAVGWDNEKLADRAGQIPSKVKEEDVTEEHRPLYDKLLAREEEEEIEVVGESEEGEEKKSKAAGKPGKSEIDVSQMMIPDLMKLIGERELDIKVSKTKTPKVQDLRKMVAKALKAQATPAAAEGAEGKPAKKNKPAVSEVERDQFGSKKGSLANIVNDCITDAWKSEADILKETKLGTVQVRDRLYAAENAGQFEKRKLIEYRIKPGFKAAKA